MISPTMVELLGLPSTKTVFRKTVLELAILSD